VTCSADANSARPLTPLRAPHAGALFLPAWPARLTATATDSSFTTVSTARLRIVSDLHIGEPHSQLPRVDLIAPLLEGTAQLVFNGDTLDTRFLEHDPVARSHKADFDAFAAAHPGRITALTGNHDPDISSLHHLELEAGRVLVTHGDTLFPEMAPWGWEAQHFRAEQERRRSALPEDQRDTLETRLRICKEAAYAIRHLSPHRPYGQHRHWRHRWHILRALMRFPRIWRCWREMPGAAARLVEVYRPAARIVILGHFHWPGVWRCRNRVVINTGAATLAHGALAVDFVGRQLQVRALRFHRSGIRLGAIREVIELDETSDRPVGGPTQ
jgi:predicted phosphodiesterase